LTSKLQVSDTILLFKNGLTTERWLDWDGRQPAAYSYLWLIEILLTKLSGSA